MPTADAAPVRNFRSLHDVDGSTPADGDVFKYEAVTGLMKKLQRNGADGYAGLDGNGLVPAPVLPPDWRLQMLASVPSPGGTDFYARFIQAKLPSDYRRLNAAVGATEPDVSANGNPAGTYFGDVTLQQPGALSWAPDKSVRFGGTTSRLSLGHPQSFDIAATGTWTIWWKTADLPAAINQCRFFFGKDESTGRSYCGGIVWDLFAGICVAMQINGSNYTSTYVPTVDGLWHMAAFVASGGTLFFYVDGVPAGSVAIPAIPVTATDMQVGERAYAGSEQRFNGWLDEFATWNGVALTAAQVAAIYDAGVAGGMIEPAASRVPGDGSGRGAVTAAFRGMNSRRTDFLIIGDSEPLLDGYGYDSGIHVALGKRGPQFAGPLFTVRENNGSGAGTGYLMSAGEAGVGSAGTGALAPHGQFLNSVFYPDGYLNSDVPNYSTGGLVVDPSSFLHTTDALLYEVHYGTFANGTHTLRLAAQPLSVTYDFGNINCTTGQIGFARQDILMPANSGRAGQTLNFQFNLFLTAGSTAVFVAYERLSNPGRRVGWSVTPLDCKGGQPTRVIAGDFLAIGDWTLAYKLSQFRRLQGDDGKTVVLIMCGQNDENDSALSVGPNPQASNTAGGRTDNIDAIIYRLRFVWQYVCGWPACDLLFLIVPSHPLDNPGTGREVWLETCRSAAAAQAIKQPFTKSIDFSRHTSYLALSTAGLYKPGDTSHMTFAGYDLLSEYIVVDASDPTLDE